MKKLLFAALLLASTVSFGQVSYTNPQPSLPGIKYQRVKSDSVQPIPRKFKTQTDRDTTPHLFFHYDTLYQRVGGVVSPVASSAGSAVVSDSLGNITRLKAKTSAGGALYSNNWTLVAEWGAGEGANFDFHGFAGYNANRSASYTVRSFTDFRFVDSSTIHNQIGINLSAQTAKFYVTDTIKTNGVVKSTQALFGDVIPPSAFQGQNFMVSQSGTASIIYNATSDGYESAYGGYTWHPINGSSSGGKMGVWSIHYGRLSPTTGSYFLEGHATKYTSGVPNDYTFFKFMPGDGAVFFPSGHNYGDTLDFPGDTLINIKGGLRVEKSAKFTEFTGYVSNVSSSYTGRSFTDKVYVDSSISAKNINSGTYTPTLTNGANVSSSSAGLCHYVRIGNEVQVQGIVTVTPTSAGGTVTEVELSLPVSSNFTAISDGWGNGNTDQTSGSNVVAYASSANDRSVVRFRAQAASATDLYFSFTYTVK